MENQRMKTIKLEDELKDPLEPSDWDRGDVILTADQVRECIEAMGEDENE